MKVTCDNCGDDVNLPNHKNKARKTSNRNHSIVICKQCGYKNFVDALTRYDKREDYYRGKET